MNHRFSITLNKPRRKRDKTEANRPLPARPSAGACASRVLRPAYAAWELVATYIFIHFILGYMPLSLERTTRKHTHTHFTPHHESVHPHHHPHQSSVTLITLITPITLITLITPIITGYHQSSPLSHHPHHACMQCARLHACNNVAACMHASLRHQSPQQAATGNCVMV